MKSSVTRLTGTEAESLVRGPACGNRGYRNIKPRRASPAPRLSPGESHSLAAEMNGSEMRVSIDGKLVWEGDLGPQGTAFDGP
jgi:hypothetical protein